MHRNWESWRIRHRQTWQKPGTSTVVRKWEVFHVTHLNLNLCHKYRVQIINQILNCDFRPNKTRIMINNSRYIFFWKSLSYVKRVGVGGSSKENTSILHSLSPPTSAEQKNKPHLISALAQIYLSSTKKNLQEGKEKHVQAEGSSGVKKTQQE